MGKHIVPSLSEAVRRHAPKIVLSILLLSSLACSLTGTAAPAAPAAPTAVAMPLVLVPTEDNLNATRVALDVKATVLAAQELNLSAKSTLAAQPLPTQPPAPTLPPPPTAVPALPTETMVPPTQTPPPTSIPPSPTPDIDLMIKNANILLYEDVAGYYNLTRWVREALDSYGFKYTDVGDAVGNFKAEILSGKKWDLVIAAAESRKGFQGELFDYLADVAQKDTAVIIETWYLESMAAGPISKITSKCGVMFQKNWMDPDRDSRSIVWLNPDHPLFHYPNEGFSLVHYAPYWEGDAGDMMQRRSSGGNGEIVAGLYTTEKSRYGTLAVCFDGRVIIQSFSTHDYRKSDMTDLWQNMAYYTLKNHFLKKTGQ